MFSGAVKPKLIIWDVGGVILDYNPKTFAKTYNQGRDEALFLKIFEGEYWKKYDRGDLNYSDFINASSLHFEVPKEKIIDMVQFAFHSLRPNWPVIQMIKELKKRGYEQYLLSNGGEEYVKHVTSSAYYQDYQFSLYELFKPEEMVISSIIKMSKPEPAIYDYTMKQFKITNPKEILFIDDSLANIIGARQKDWRAVHFKGAADLVRKLHFYNIHLGQDEKAELYLKANL